MVYGFSQVYDMYIWDMWDWEKNRDTGDERDMKEILEFYGENGAVWEHLSVLRA